jgi:hypothetical protein
MTTSLNSFIPFLSETLLLNPSALYERLRALVRLGLLVSAKGRGPGSGVRLGPETLATFLISFMASDNIADAAQTTTALSNAPLNAHSIKGDKALGGAKTFKAALVNILTVDAVAEEFAWLRVHRGETPTAEVFIRSSDGLQDEDDEGLHLFASSDWLGKARISGGLIVSVTLNTNTISLIRERLKKLDRTAEARKALQDGIEPILRRGK